MKNKIIEKLKKIYIEKFTLQFFPHDNPEDYKFLRHLVFILQRSVHKIVQYYKSSSTEIDVKYKKALIYINNYTLIMSTYIGDPVFKLRDNELCGKKLDNYAKKFRDEATMEYDQKKFNSKFKLSFVSTNQIFKVVIECLNDNFKKYIKAYDLQKEFSYIYRLGVKYYDYFENELLKITAFKPEPVVEPVPEPVKIEKKYSKYSKYVGINLKNWKQSLNTED
ncbi:MAG: hypothetical protein ACRCZ2_06560 [Fusobacteriaceae bacterium]